MNSLKATKIADRLEVDNQNLLEKVIELAYIEGSINILGDILDEKIDQDIAKIWNALRARFDILTNEKK